MNASVGWPHSFIRGVVQAALGALCESRPGPRVHVPVVLRPAAVVDYSEPSILGGGWDRRVRRLVHKVPEDTEAQVHLAASANDSPEEFFK